MKPPLVLPLLLLAVLVLAKQCRCFYTEPVQRYEEMTLTMTCPRGHTSVRWGRRHSLHQIEWLKETRRILIPRNQEENLIIRYVRKDDEDLYDCTTNDGTIIHRFNVTILFSRLRANRHNKLVVEGSSATLQCDLNGFVRRVKWYYRSSSNDPASKVQESDRVFTTSIDDKIYTLTIKNVTNSDKGTYVCSGQLPSERSLNDSIRLEVEQLPRIRPIIPRNYYVVIGQSLNVSCTADHLEGADDFRWTRDNEMIASGTLRQTITLSLFLKKLQKDDEGQYSCVVSRGNYSYQISISITVLDLPPLPENVTVECICGWGFNVTWQIVVGNSAVLHPDKYTIGILRHSVNFTSSPKSLAFSTKQRHFGYLEKGICTTFVSKIYIVEVQSQNSTFNSCSHFVRFSSVIWRKSEYLNLTKDSIPFKNFFSKKPPEVQIRVIKTTCSCSLSAPVSPQNFRQIVLDIFGNFTARHLLKPNHKTRMQIKGKEREAFIVTFQGHLNTSLNTEEISQVLNSLGKRGPKCVYLNNCWYFFDAYCEPVFWKKVPSSSCFVSSEKEEASSCKTAQKNFVDKNRLKKGC